MSLLEFGRSVHAELAALMAATRRGISVKEATLFSTTFPCHMCARHIVAAGIRRVVYIEPYPKSRARELYPDSICVDPPARQKDMVNFEPFVGIAPRQYLDIFDAGDTRKDKAGRPVDWRTSRKTPRLMRFMNTYRQIEEAVVAFEIPDLAAKLGVNLDLFNNTGVQKGDS
jgi:cytidine deaminase